MMTNRATRRRPSGDGGRASYSRRATPARALLPLLLLPLALAVPRDGRAQMVATPVLQNAFTNPGITAAVDFGSATGARTYGLAAAWAPGRGRFVLSAGAGALDPSAAGASARTTYGARLAVGLRQFMSGAVGLTGFVGIGGAAGKGDVPAVATLPAGVSVGWRHAVGATRGVSVYAAPFYSLARTSAGGTTTSSGQFRVSGGVDFSLTPRIGVTIGAETGAEARADKPGPRSSVFGAGLSYAFK